MYICTTFHDHFLVAVFKQGSHAAEGQCYTGHFSSTGLPQLVNKRSRETTMFPALVLYVSSMHAQHRVYCPEGGTPCCPEGGTPCCPPHKSGDLRTSLSPHLSSSTRVGCTHCSWRVETAPWIQGPAMTWEGTWRQEEGGNADCSTYVHTYIHTHTYIHRYTHFTIISFAKHLTSSLTFAHITTHVKDQNNAWQPNTQR